VHNRSVLRSRISAIQLFALVAIGAALPQSPALAAQKAPEKYAAIVVDAVTGDTLHARYADDRRYPASLTKIMTLYVLFEELDAKRLALDSRLSVSANAAAQAPSKLGLKAGSSIAVEDAILALTTKSANDAAVVVAENVSGSVSAFAERMNRTARALAMHGTTFRNPNGLPNPGQVTTARDMVKLSHALQTRFPQYYRFFGERSFTFKGKRYRNHNRLLGSVEGVDGIKTGYTRASGFNLVSNVRRGNRHLIAVVMGGRTAASRDAEMRRLIAEYLPEAKKGDSSDLLIADASEDDVRMPRPRPARAEEAALAFTAPLPPKDIVGAALSEAKAAEAAPAPLDPVMARISAATEVAELAYRSEGDTGGGAMARLKEMAELRSGKRDMIAAKQAPAAARATAAETESGRDGWHIQIGAVPTEEAARALLDKARGSLGQALASAEPFTQPVERDGATLYRARFAGFADKNAARQTCAKLKSKSISCLAVPN